MELEVLLSGPRGRRFFLEFALAGRSVDTAEIATLRQLLFFASYRLESAQGRGGALFGPGAGEPLPDPSAAAVAGALDAVPLITVDELNALAAFSRSVDAARYWQAAEGTDELLLGNEMRTALERVSAQLSATHAIVWWTEPVDPEQWSVDFRDSAGRDGFQRPSAAQALRNGSEQQAANERRAERERPTAPDANSSGEWWSKPPSALTSSTRRISGLGPVGPSTNYASLNDKQTWICTLAMFLGRIELFTFLVLFTRTFWRK